MKKLFLLMGLSLMVHLLTGCSSHPQNYTISGSVYFGGEPKTALPVPSVSSLNFSITDNYTSTAVNSYTVSSGQPGSLIVSCDPGISPEAQVKALNGLGFKIMRRLYADPNSYVVASDSLSIAQAYEIARQSPLINKVEYNNKIIKQSVTPNDTYYSRQWDLKITKFDAAWDQFKGRDPVTVAVLDTGLNTASVEFTNRLAPPVDWYDFVDSDTDPSDNVYTSPEDRYSHGTNVAGIIAANPDNSYGYAGCTWSQAIKILPVRVLDSNGSGTVDALVDGINWAVQHHANIINLSLGMSGDNDSVLLDNAVSNANNNGVTIVCAAGNENGPVDYPARLSVAYPNVIAVGATGYFNAKASYSCFGPELTVMAPGGDDQINGSQWQQFIWNITYDKHAQSEEMNCGFIGTSQATPHVTALGALLYSYGITSPAQIRNIITQTATDFGLSDRHVKYGYGLINAFAALTAATNDITNVTIGIRDTQTKKDLLPSPVKPDNEGAFTLPDIPQGSWEIYAQYTGLTNGYKYYGSVPLDITKSMSLNLPLQLIPNN